MRYIMFLVTVDVKLNGPSGRMLEWPTFRVTFHVLFLFYSHYIILKKKIISESDPFSFNIQPISLQHICYWKWLQICCKDMGWMWKENEPDSEITKFSKIM